MEPDFRTILKFNLSEHHEMVVKSIFYSMNVIRHYKHPPKVYITVIRILMYYYKKLNEKLYLDLAFFHVYAFLCAGYGWEPHEKLFNKIIFDKTQMTLEKFIKISDCMYKEIPCTPYGIRRALGRWPAQRNPKLTATYAINEILQNIKNKQIGIYTYMKKKLGVPTPIYVQIEDKYTYIIGANNECSKIKNN